MQKEILDIDVKKNINSVYKFVLKTVRERKRELNSPPHPKGHPSRGE